MNRYFIWFLFLPLAAIAELPVTRLHHIFPPGGKVGTTFEVEINGTDWEGAKQLQFSHPGISAAGSNKFTITIASNVPPGFYDARISGTFGVSNPRLFAVGLLSESGETTNAVYLGTVINGRVDQNGVDEFTIAATKEKPITFRCVATEIESRLEPVMVLFDSKGRELVRCRRGNVFHFTPTETEQLRLRLHDKLYRGGPDFFYRLEVGTFPHIESAIAGNKVRWQGNNLPEQAVEVPVAEPFSWAGGIPALGGVSAMPIFPRALVKLPSSPLQLEHESNASQEILPPCEIRGTFTNGDIDIYHFQASKGEVFWMELVSHRIGEPADAALVVKFAGAKTNDVLELNDSEGNFGGNEFNTTHRDFSGRFEAKQSGTYLLQLRNLFSVPDGALPVYYLAIRKESPGFGLAAMPNLPLPPKPDSKELPLTTTAFRRGETHAVKVVAFRRDGFNGEIDLRAQDLPSGISSPGGKIHAGKNSGLLFLRADSEAGASQINLKIMGTANNMEKQAQPVTLVRTVPNRDEEGTVSRFSTHFVGSIIEAPAAIRVQPETNFFSASAGTEISIPFIVAKQCELKSPFKMKPAGLPEVEQGKEIEITPTATNVVLKLNLGKPKLAPGRYFFALQGLAEIKPIKDSKIPGLKETSITVYSDPMTIEVTPEQLQAAAK